MRFNHLVLISFVTDLPKSSLYPLPGVLLLDALSSPPTPRDLGEGASLEVGAVRMHLLAGVQRMVPT